MSKQAIIDFAKAKEIPYLLHFTRTVNLASILQHGLYPVNLAQQIGVNPVINDHLRLDGNLGGISTSIAHPNYKMFYKLRQENEGVDWAVLALHPSIMWTKDCGFCRHNAADIRISSQPIADLKTPAALAGMYEEIEGITPRAEQRLKPYDPTDPQAEILVFDRIEPELIIGAAFETEAVREPLAGLFGGRKLLAQGPRKGLFATRSYVR